MVSPEQVIARIGSLPIGDPDAIRSHAQRLRADADALVARCDHVIAEVRATGFEGPAATRWRHAMDGCAADARHAAGELQALADRLTQTAARVESTQSAWHRAFDRVAAQLEAAARERLR